MTTSAVAATSLPDDLFLDLNRSSRAGPAHLERAPRRGAVRHRLQHRRPRHRAHRAASERRAAGPAGRRTCTARAASSASSRYGRPLRPSCAPGSIRSPLSPPRGYSPTGPAVRLPAPASATGSTGPSRSLSSTARHRAASTSRRTRCATPRPCTCSNRAPTLRSSPCGSAMKARPQRISTSKPPSPPKKKPPSPPEKPYCAGWPTRDRHRHVSSRRPAPGISARPFIMCGHTAAIHPSGRGPPVGQQITPA
jgi:hypothetical protein